MSKGGNSTKRLTFEKFLERCAKHKMSENYDFSETVFVNVRTKIKVKCNIHDEFIVGPISIMNGSGCKLCMRHEDPSRKVALSLDEYIYIASRLHNNKYDYSKVDITHDKVTIICPEHGEFLLRRSAHISPTQLYGCQKCGNVLSKGEERIITFLEVNNIKYEYQKSFDWATSPIKNMPLRFDFI